eukprot:1149775-Pelagomonas_calceolata.AAC.5
MPHDIPHEVFQCGAHLLDDVMPQDGWGQTPAEEVQHVLTLGQLLGNHRHFANAYGDVSKTCYTQRENNEEIAQAFVGAHVPCRVERMHAGLKERRTARANKQCLTTPIQEQRTPRARLTAHAAKPEQ